MSAGHTIGFECELDGPNPNDYVEPLRKAGLSNLTQVHANKCTCGECAWGNQRLRAMRDGRTELVSDPLPWPDPDTFALLSQTEEIIAAVGGRAGPGAGFHIHVSADADPAQLLGYFGWYEREFAQFARQGDPNVRSYNGWCSGRVPSDDEAVMAIPTLPGRDWDRTMPARNLNEISHKMRTGNEGPLKSGPCCWRGETFEFRIWNSIVTAWRMYLGIEISCAFLDAVNAAPPIRPGQEIETGTLLDFLAPHLDDTGFGYALRHLAHIEAGEGVLL